MSLRVVPVEPGAADAVEAWRAIHNAIIPAHPLSTDDVRERSTRNRLTLGHDGEQLVGNATLRPPEPGSSAATVIVRVLPEHRRRGLGSQYLAGQLAAVRSLSDDPAVGWTADQVATVVLAANADGLAFAVSHGFVEVERYEVDGAEYVDLLRALPGGEPGAASPPGRMAR